MTYQSLYRRHRPLLFSEMIGQEHIIRTLKNALLLKRVAHAYLFSGPRGTGKTTMARIFARAMNCAGYPAEEPCGKCPSCLDIAAGVSIDLIEIDAASFGRVDDIRELTEKTRFASGQSRFKIYIIDEAHMLTAAAANAFLKTLEEPPPDVVFILATTNPANLPVTIVSRCQRFDFHLLTAAQIRTKLEELLRAEKWLAESEAIDLIARLAEGSLRDALGILEQCAAYGEEAITAEQVRLVTGATKTDYLETIVGALVENDIESGLEAIEQVVCSGRDLQLFQRDFAYILSRLLVAGSSENQQAEAPVAVHDQIVDKFKGRLSQNDLLNLVELLHESAAELRRAHLPQYILEIMLIRMVRLLHGCVQEAGLLQPAAPARQKPAAAAEAPVMEKPAAEAPVIGKQAPATETPVTEKPGAAVKTRAAVQSPAPPEPAKEPATDRPQAGAKAPAIEIPEAAAKAKGKETPAAKEPAALDKTPAVAKEEEDTRWAELQAAWPRIINEVKKRQKTTAAWIEPATLTALTGRRVLVTLGPDYDVHRSRLMTDTHRKLVEAVLTAFFGEETELMAETRLAEEGEIAEAKAAYTEEEPPDLLPGPEAGFAHEPSEGLAAPPVSWPEEAAEAGGGNAGELPPVAEKEPEKSAFEEAQDIFGGRVINLDEEEEA